MRRRIDRPFVATVAATAASVVCSRALSAERQWHVGADGGWSAVSYQGSTYGGWGGGAHLSYGLTDSFNAMLELETTIHPIAQHHPNLLIMSGAAGAAYTFDVLRWVPYAGVLVGGYRFSGADMRKADAKLGFQFAVGLDYAISRSWVVGAQVRYHTFSDDPFNAHYLTTFARVDYVWGW